MSEIILAHQKHPVETGAELLLKIKAVTTGEVAKLVKIAQKSRLREEGIPPVVCLPESRLPVDLLARFTTLARNGREAELFLMREDIWSEPTPNTPYMLHDYRTSLKPRSLKGHFDLTLAETLFLIMQFPQIISSGSVCGIHVKGSRHVQSGKVYHLHVYRLGDKNDPKGPYLKIARERERFIDARYLWIQAKRLPI
jgi:hypothetical protein